MDVEENIELPLLEEAISPNESQRLARWLEEIKIFLPTRAHQHVPNKQPVAETAVGLLTAPIDHVTDMFRRWPNTNDVKQPGDVDVKQKQPAAAEPV